MYRKAIVTMTLLSACAKPEPADPAWRASVEQFHQARADIIGGEDGWVTLIGRFVLEPGVNTVGSDPGSSAVLPADRAPAKAFTLDVETTTLKVTAADGVDLRVKGVKVATLELSDDSEGAPTVLELGSLRLHVIRRGDRFMLRVKDREHPARKTFTGLDWFPLAPQWRLKAHLEAAPTGTTLAINNVLNQTEADASPGHLVFTVDGQPRRLAAIQEAGEDGLFIIFRDQTAGHGSYPAGRFINTRAPDADGNVELDFNRAYSPPCAFTEFATCPLPPKENQLPLKIEAGERWAGHG